MTFVPQTLGVKDCTDPVVTGTPSTRFDFIQKVSNNDANDVNAIGGFEVPDMAMTLYRLPIPCPPTSSVVSPTSLLYPESRDSLCFSSSEASINI